MKLLLVVAGLCLSCVGYSQRLGINTSNPSEALDVNGSINLNGTIKANGVAGTSGQVLTSTADGMSWATLAGQYKRFIQYFSNADAAGSFVFTVPTGVYEVFIELWGAGGGGSNGGGGASGHYRAVWAPVTPGLSINISTGAAGKGALVGGLIGNRSATIGQSSSVSIASNQFIALGGNAAIGSDPGQATAPVYIVPPSTYSTFTLPGEAGQDGAITTLYFPTSSVTDYNSLFNGGEGGASYQFAGQQGKGGQYYRYNIGIPTNTVFKDATSAAGFGCGGGGILSATAPGSQRAAGNGSPGMVIVRW
jgi:hypothetical protein